MSITRSQLAGLYPVGEYELEIVGCEHVAGKNKITNKPWEMVLLKTEIISPESLGGAQYTTRMFYDNRLGKLITVGLGKSLDDIFGKGDSIDKDKLFGVLKGQFVRVRLGEKNGYNEIAEILPPTNEKSNTRTPGTPEEV